MNDQAVAFETLSYSTRPSIAVDELLRRGSSEVERRLRSTTPPSMQDTLALVLAGGKGTRLGTLTARRAKPAVPIGGKYRIIDFALSNCLNSRVPHVGVLTQHLAQSLVPHLESWSLQALRRGQSLRPLRARRQHLPRHRRRRPPEPRRHPLAGAVARAGARRGSRLSHGLRGDARRPPAQRGAGHGRLRGSPVDRGPGLRRDGGRRERSHHFVRREAGVAQAHPGSRRRRAGVDGHLRLRHLLPAARPGRRRGQSGLGARLRQGSDPERRRHTAHVQAHRLRDAARPHRGAYWRDIGTVDAYCRTSLELADRRVGTDFDDAAWPIHGTMGASLDCVAAAMPEVVRDRRNVLFPGAQVARGAHVEDSVILPGARIGKGCVIRKAIVEEGCALAEGARIGVDPDQDRARFEVSPQGVVLVSSPLRAAA